MGRAVLVSTSMVVSVLPGHMHSPSGVVVPSENGVDDVDPPDSVVDVVDVEGQIQTVVEAGVVLVVVVVD
jgi:hypothetical protein